MHTKKLLSFTLVAFIFLSGCATVPMASGDRDIARKSFNAPPPNKSGLYVYRNSSFGGALKKNVYLDGQFIGESAPKTYFYRDIVPGQHKISTESEFSDNALNINTEAGKNYYVRQYIKMGLFVGGANLELKSEAEGQNGVLECGLAQ